MEQITSTGHCWGPEAPLHSAIDHCAQLFGKSTWATGASCEMLQVCTSPAYSCPLFRLRTAQQVYRCAHFLLGICFSLNLSAHPDVGIPLPKRVFHQDNEDCENTLAQHEGTRVTSERQRPSGCPQSSQANVTRNPTAAVFSSTSSLP